MTKLAFHGLDILIERYCPLDGTYNWIARIKEVPWLVGIGDEPLLALKALHDRWDLLNEVQIRDYHLRHIDTDYVDTLIGQYETQEEAEKHLATLSLVPENTWYITQQNQIVAQGRLRATD